MPVLFAILCGTLSLVFPALAAAQAQPEPDPATPPPTEVVVEIDAPSTVFSGVPFSITLSVPDSLWPETPVTVEDVQQGGGPRAFDRQYSILSRTGQSLASGMLAREGTVVEGLVVRSAAELPLSVVASGTSESLVPRVMPGWISLVPPLLAILLALIFREVIISLFAGIWLGALLLTGFNPISATLEALDHFIVGALANDADRFSIIVFSFLLGGMVGVLTRSGGANGIVDALSPYATTRRRGQLMAWFAGLVIFFDDYANTLIVGPTMRPVTDRLRVSREKLAYIVDSTSAPVAGLAAISTWVGFEISLIAAALENAAAQAPDEATRAELLESAGNAFLVFIHTIPYRFYPIFTIALVLMIALTRRDFGPMLAAERRAARGGGVLREGATPMADLSSAAMLPPEDAPRRWYNAVLPVLTVMIVALIGIVSTGLASLGPGDHAVWDIVGAGDAFRSLIWASFAGCVVALTLAVGQRILRLRDAMEALVTGMRAMLLAMVILVLAWGLGGVTEEMGVGSYLAEVVGGSLPVGLLPVVVFFVAAAISFATGTSWGTMAILFPVVVPLAIAMGAGVNFEAGDHYTILLGAISSILAGSIFGDHCSPISDTTVLSSMASSCDHIDHVRTQLPYALLAAAVGTTVGDIPTAYGLSPWISIAVGLVLLYLALKIFGRRVEDADVGTDPAKEGTSEVGAW